MTAMTVVNERKKRANALKLKEIEKIEYLERELELMQKSLEINQQALSDIILVLKEHEIKIRELERELSDLTQFYDLLHITAALISKHYANIRKMEAFFSQNLKSEIFSIIDIDQFEKKIEKIKLELDEQHMLPPVTTTDLVQVSKVHTIHNMSHLAIVIKIPLLQLQSLEIKEFFPVPFTKMNRTFLLNLESEIFTGNNEEIYIIPKTALENCILFPNMTICNSMVKRMFTDPTLCVSQLLYHENDDNCTTHEIVKKNHFIKISNKSLYCYIVEPITLRLLCADESILFNMTHSEIISYSEFCEFGEYSNDTHDVMTLYSEETEIDMIPEIHVYNETSQWFTNISILTSDELQLLKLRQESKVLEDTLNKFKKEILEIKKETIWDSLSCYWKDFEDYCGPTWGKLVVTICKSVILPVALILTTICTIKYVLWKIMCR